MKCRAAGRWLLSLAVTASILWQSGPATAQSLARIEVRAFPSVTLDGPQFLTGEGVGESVTLAGELRLPSSGAAKLPAVVLIHGSGGIDASTDRWAWELNGIGVAAFIVDSFSGRGIVSAVEDQTRLNSLAMMIDAYRALDLLAADPRIDPGRIAVMGFSKGAVASVYSSNERFRRLHGSETATFAAHIGFYTPCNVAYTGDTVTTGKPIRLFHGSADDYVPIGPCRAYAERLKRRGADVTLTEYAEAQHGFDIFFLPPVLAVPHGQTTRNCTLREGDGGTIVNAATATLYDIRTDPCVERGPHVGYDSAAHEQSVAAVKEFLTQVFHLR